MRILSALRHNSGRNAAAVASSYNQMNPDAKWNVNLFQRIMLTAGSGLVSIFDPARDDMISAFGELTGQAVLPQIYREMISDPEGARILSERPIINSQTVNLIALAALPPHTFGYQYTKFLRDNRITPDSRKPVLFIEDPDLAYVMLRYRQIHDFTHCILGMKTNMLGEVTVKVFEAIQLNLPMCWLAGMFGVLRLGPKHTQRYMNEHLEWIIENAENAKPLISVYFEKHFETPIDELRSRLNLILLKDKQSSSN